MNDGREKSGMVQRKTSHRVQTLELSDPMVGTKVFSDFTQRSGRIGQGLYFFRFEIDNDFCLLKQGRLRQVGTRVFVGHCCSLGSMVCGGKKEMC